MKQLLLLLLSVTFLSASLRAELSVGETPEWLAHESTLTFTGVPQHVETSPLVGERWVTRVRFKIDKCIKGALSAGDSVTVTSIDDKDTVDRMNFRNAVEKQRGVLVLATIAKNTFPRTDGIYLFLKHGLDQDVFFADEPAQRIYDAEGKALRDYREVLQRIEMQTRKEAELVKNRWKGQIRERRIEAEPVVSDPFKELYGGSAVLLMTIEYQEESGKPAEME